jgi:hypothetical protein
MGLYRLHWLTEWQKRGVPHLHFAAWFNMPESDYDQQVLPVLIKADWLYLTCRLRSSDKGQHVEPFFNELGWLQYLAKHCSRGAAHYQRDNENIPDGWKKTGRMWGHSKKWPTTKPKDIEFDNIHVWYDVRRIVRSWRISNARSEPMNQGSKRGPRISSARHMLRCPDMKSSKYRGVSEWINGHVANEIYDWSQEIHSPSSSFLEWSLAQSG